MVTLEETRKPKHNIHPLKRDEKQEQLKRKMTVVSATLDYLIVHYVGEMISDNFDPSKDYYEQQKVQAEKYFKLRRLDRL